MSLPDNLAALQQFLQATAEYTMTSSPPSAETPKQVAELATEQVNLPRVALIGIFGSEADPRALIRRPNGKIDRVAVGDTAAGGIVTAIGADKVVITQRGDTKVLQLPQS